MIVIRMDLTALPSMEIQFSQWPIDAHEAFKVTGGRWMAVHATACCPPINSAMRYHRQIHAVHLGGDFFLFCCVLCGLSHHSKLTTFIRRSPFNVLVFVDSKASWNNNVNIRARIFARKTVI